jgi:CheY-like chemotaxis protein
MPLPRPCRVLVVDDHPDTADSFAFLLEAMGHPAQRVLNPLEAEGAIERFRPHVVLMDIGMPLIDGWTLAKRIRARPEWRELKLVAVTAYSGAQDRVASREAGLDAHIAKPLDPRLLQALLEQCFEEPVRLPKSPPG